MLQINDIGIDLIVGFMLLVAPNSLRLDEFAAEESFGTRLVGLTVLLLGAFLAWRLTGGVAPELAFGIGVNLSVAALLFTVACGDMLEIPSPNWSLLWIFSAILTVDSLFETLIG